MEEFDIKICNIETQTNDVDQINEIMSNIEPINAIKKLGRKISSLNKTLKYQLSIYNHIKRRYVVIGSYPSFAVISKRLSEHDIIMTASILQNIYSGKNLKKLDLIDKIK
jgi:hypothetical protein